MDLNRGNAKKILSDMQNRCCYWPEACEMAMLASAELNYFDIITSIELDSMTAEKAKNGYASLYNFISDLDGHLNDGYFRLDGYDNAIPLTYEYVMEILEEYINSN